MPSIQAPPAAEASPPSATGMSSQSSRRHASSTASTVSTASQVSTAPSEAPDILPAMRNERVVASGSGVVVSVALVEPVLFFEGFDRQGSAPGKTSILRGTLHLRVSKAAKIKKVYLTFKGSSQIFWPEGVSLKRSSHTEHNSLINHTWTFFNAQFPHCQYGYGTNHVVLEPSKDSKDYKSQLKESTLEVGAKSLSAKEYKRLSLQSNQSRSFGKGESPSESPTVAHKGHKVFQPGDYMYSFEFPIPSRLPESIRTDLGFVKYELEALVERAGTFRNHLVGSREIPFIRTPGENSLERVEPIAISRAWEDQLAYDIIISGKCFPLGSQIPIAFKLTPLAKVACHSIKVYVTENQQYWNKNKSAGRLDSGKKLLLFDKHAGTNSVSAFPGSAVRVTAGGGIPWDHRAAAARGEEYVDSNRTSLLGDLGEENFGTGPTEMEFSVQLPSCTNMKPKDGNQRLHFDTSYEHIEIHHWIKIVLRLSRPDKDDPSQRRHFEISIDSPLHIMSCLATQQNLDLPAYSSPYLSPSETTAYECGCPDASPVERPPSSPRSAGNSSDPSFSQPARSFTSGSGGLARPPTAHINDPQNEQAPRPMHLIRVPSFAPPSFDEVEPPPPLITPPPNYTAIIGDEGGMESYFERLHLAEQELDESVRGSSRIDVPLTPGGRVNRSMDVPREWIQIGDPSPDR